LNNPISQKILNLFRTYPKDSFRLNTIIKKLRLQNATKGEVRGALNNLSGTGLISKKDNLYSLNQSASHKDKLKIKSKNRNKKPHKEIIPKKVSGKKQIEFTNLDLKVSQGEIVSVTGKYEFSRDKGILIADWRLRKEIIIRHSDNIGAEHGDKILVEIINPNDLKNEYSEIYGRVIEILGASGEMDTEILAVMRKFNLNKEFPLTVNDEANKIKFRSDTRGRLDLREEIIFTIDPADAKDFDDAISLTKNDDGDIVLGVHIADVSHYVKENSPLDAEALKRGTSVYLVNSVVPMLPEKLSNDICSLKPNVDRLTFSVFITLNKKYGVKNFEISKTIINSKRRFSYEEAQDIINSGKGDFAKELKKMMAVSKKLTELRIKDGSLDFESKEVKFVTDKKGKVIAIKVKERIDTMRMIEEFMLLANKCVTKYVTNLSKEHKTTYPFIYRVHDNPDPEKLYTLSEYVKQFGYEIKISFPKPDKNELKKLLEIIKGRPEEYVINDLLIRSMAKAVYTDKNIGHYGLGFDDYTHFTSPIRRYPDLMVHRILFDYLKNTKTIKQQISHYKKILPDICKQNTLSEINAVNAEREVIKLKQIEYISKHIGEEFSGLITGIMERGIFIELSDILVEGMVRYKDIPDDYYEFDSKKQIAIGRRRRKIFKSGDVVQVKVIRANLDNKKIDFLLI